MSEDREIFGRYELVRQIAQGGMAEIFLAAECGFGGFERQLVVKRIRKEMTVEREFVTMFTDEARLVSKLSHPNIANVYDFGEVELVYYLTMEFVDGLTVAQLIKRRKAGIPLEITLRIVADACAGLHYAHELCDDQGNHLKVVHRDVSPQNVMISKSGMAKLIDFGVARAATQVHRTAVDQLKGKLAYMAPELLVPTAKRVVDRRADIFAAGILLFEMVTGRRLFKRKTQAETLFAVRDEYPPSVEPVGAPPEIDVIIKRAGEKDPENRYATAQEMQDDIEELIVELVSKGAKLVTPHSISRFVEEYLSDEYADGDDEDSYSVDSDADDTMPGEKPSFSFDNLPVMPGATPIPEKAEQSSNNETEPSVPLPLQPAPQPPPRPTSSSASSRTEQPTPSETSLPLMSDSAPFLGAALPHEKRRRALLLIAMVIFCLIVSIAVGFAAGSRVGHEAPSATPGDGPAVTEASDGAVPDKDRTKRR